MINNGLNILKKHRFQTVVMILLVCLCLYILGVAFVAKNTSDEFKHHTCNSSLSQTHQKGNTGYRAVLL